jgi:hypothetical protein
MVLRYIGARKGQIHPLQTTPPGESKINGNLGLLEDYGRASRSVSNNLSGMLFVPRNPARSIVLFFADPGGGSNNEGSGD